VTGRLEPSELLDDPMVTFAAWFDHARRNGQSEPEAMAVATVGSDGTPSVRMVLMRGLDQRGFVFYTNRRSRKGSELAGQPKAAAVFRWKAVDRQVRLAGPVDQVDDAEADSYFASRARGSQLAAWASDQSETVADRATLEQRWAKADRRFDGTEVSRPPWWGGYRIRPVEIEFWQEGDYRMHDRFRYLVQPDGTWRVDRLYP
jgi:pyridoxamine 5'-phosphate oxidase